MQFFSFLSSSISTIFWFLVVLIPLVVVHEFGHLLVARLFGVKIPEFGVGMPLTRHRISRTYKGINWSIYPWLLGGFVRIYGDHDALDQAYEEYRQNPTKARHDYISDKFSEVIQTQELRQFLTDNSLEMGPDWIWFDNLVLNLKDKPNISDFTKALQKCQTYPQFILDLPFGNLFHNTPNDSENVIKKLDQDQKQVLTDAFQKQYDSKKNTLETLIDWEFDAKISSGNPRAIRDAFFNKNWVQQSLIIFGGIIFNILTAWFLMILVFGFFGTINSSQTLDKQPIFWNQITEWRKTQQVNLLSDHLLVTGLVKDSPADKAGLKPKDELLKINDKELTQVDSLDSFRNNIKADGLPIKLEYRPAGSSTLETKTVSIVPNIENNQAKLGIGVGYVVSRKAQNIGQAITLGWSETGKVAMATVGGLTDLLKAPFQQDKSALNNAGGPILVAYVSNQIFGLEGIRGILYFMATISVGLAIFNLLPIPALDGGRFVLLTLNKILGKRNKKFETVAISATFIFLLILAVIIAGNDIYRIVNKVI